MSAVQLPISNTESATSYYQRWLGNLREACQADQPEALKALIRERLQLPPDLVLLREEFDVADLLRVLYSEQRRQQYPRACQNLRRAAVELYAETLRQAIPEDRFLVLLGHVVEYYEFTREPEAVAIIHDATWGWLWRQSWPLHAGYACESRELAIAAEAFDMWRITRVSWTEAVAESLAPLMLKVLAEASHNLINFSPNGERFRWLRAAFQTALCLAPAQTAQEYLIPTVRTIASWGESLWLAKWVRLCREYGALWHQEPACKTEFSRGWELARWADPLEATTIEYLEKTLVALDLPMKRSWEGKDSALPVFIRPTQPFATADEWYDWLDSQRSYLKFLATQEDFAQFCLEAFPQVSDEDLRNDLSGKAWMWYLKDYSERSLIS